MEIKNKFYLNPDDPEMDRIYEMIIQDDYPKNDIKYGPKDGTYLDRVQEGSDLLIKENPDLITAILHDTTNVIRLKRKN